MSRLALRTRAWMALPVLAAVLITSGCGFRPLYGPASQDTALEAVYVDIIPDRRGQLLRQALQARLGGSAEAARYRFELAVRYEFGAEGLGVQPDNSSTRTRFSAHATWVLRRPGAGGGVITSGSASALDGANVINEQFFYSDLSEQAAERRMGDLLADQIVQSVATYLRTHRELG